MSLFFVVGLILEKSGSKRFNFSSIGMLLPTSDALKVLTYFGVCVSVIFSCTVVSGTDHVWTCLH